MEKIPNYTKMVYFTIFKMPLFCFKFVSMVWATFIDYHMQYTTVQYTEAEYHMQEQII